MSKEREFEFKIGDKVEISLSGRVVALEEDRLDFRTSGGRRVLYRVYNEEGEFSVQVPLDALVRKDSGS